MTESLRTFVRTEQKPSPLYLYTDRFAKFRFILLLFGLFVGSLSGFSQNYGPDFPVIEKEKLLLDLELLYQALDQYHSGMYWYTPKDSVDQLYNEIRDRIDGDMSVTEFYKDVASLTALSREGHTEVQIPEEVRELTRAKGRFLPLTVVFLGDKMYCTRNGSGMKADVEYREIESINGENPKTIASKIGTMIPVDGFNSSALFHELNGFRFSQLHFLYFGETDRFQIKFKGIARPLSLPALNLAEINRNLKTEIKTSQTTSKYEPLKFAVFYDSIAYLGIHTFNNSTIKKYSDFKSLYQFLEKSFEEIIEKKINHLILDVSKNSGGNEGNAGLLYSYFGSNYQKYSRVLARSQKVILDNGTDPVIKLKTFGFFEKLFDNKKMPGGSYERKMNAGHGLMAFRKEPGYKYPGAHIYVIISPETYSGASEFASIMHSRKLATFVGEETGGGYYGNTSGYSRELKLPHSGILVRIPLLRFEMNVAKDIPFGRGVLPDYEVIPTIEQYRNNEEVSLNFILNTLIRKL